MSLNKLSRMLYGLLGYNIFEIKIEITWKILQTWVTQAYHVGGPICRETSEIRPRMLFFIYSF